MGVVAGLADGLDLPLRIAPAPHRLAGRARGCFELAERLVALAHGFLTLPRGVFQLARGVGQFAAAAVAFLHRGIPLLNERSHFHKLRAEMRLAVAERGDLLRRLGELLHGAVALALGGANGLLELLQKALRVAFPRACRQVCDRQRRRRGSRDELDVIGAIRLRLGHSRDVAGPWTSGLASLPKHHPCPAPDRSSAAAEPARKSGGGRPPRGKRPANFTVGAEGELSEKLRASHDPGPKNHQCNDPAAPLASSRGRFSLCRRSPPPISPRRPEIPRLPKPRESSPAGLLESRSSSP